MMAQLILLLLAGGTLAWASGSLGRAWPRWVSLLTLAGAGLYLLAAATALPPELFSLTPMPSQPESWLMHESYQWIPRFGIRVELAPGRSQPDPAGADPAAGDCRGAVILERGGAAQRLLPCQPDVDPGRGGRGVPGRGSVPVLPCSGR